MNESISTQWHYETFESTRRKYNYCSYIILLKQTLKIELLFIKLNLFCYAYCYNLVDIVLYLSMYIMFYYCDIKHFRPYTV